MEVKQIKPREEVSLPPTEASQATEQRPLCIWHKGCIDGFTSAWVVHAYFGSKVDLYEGVYQEPPPDVSGRNVLMVDFSYKKDVIEEMRKTAKAILIIDHHKTAQADLKDYQPTSAQVKEYPHFPKEGECLAFFDMERSGAGLCWNFFFPGMPMPRFIRHVQDRDLWQFKMGGTKEVNALAYSHDFNMELWDRLIEMCENDQGFQSMIVQGTTLERQRNKDVAALIEHGKRMETVGGVEMPVVCAPWFFASEIGNKLSQTHDCKCGATYYDRGDGKRVWSLRSIDGGPDVSDICKAQGGGGHARAAGFTEPLEKTNES